jgi:hypothetical protein
LTKGIAKRNWHGSKTCCFCHKDETIRHLFFNATLLVLEVFLTCLVDG